MDTPRRGLPNASPNPMKDVPIRPVLGMWTLDSGGDCPSGASPDMLNCMVQKGMLCKRPGYVKYHLDDPFEGAPVIGIFSTQPSDDNTYIIVVTTTHVYLYDPVLVQWDEVTGAGLNGNSSFLASFALSEDKVVFANFFDKVQLVDLAGLTYADLDANAPASRWLIRFNGRLNLLKTKEGGDILPYRHRWSVRDDHSDWTGIGSGFRDQTEFPAHLKGARRLSNGMALYYERAIEMVFENPDASLPFIYDGRVQDEGLYALNSLAGNKDRNFLMGVGNLFEFNGSVLQEIFTQVRESIYGSVVPRLLDTFFGVVNDANQEYILFVVEGGGVIPNKQWVWNWARRISYPWDIADMRCAALHKWDDTLTIDETPGIIDDQNYPYDDPQLQESYPVLMLGGEDGFVYRVGTALLSDDGEEITAYWTSHDLNSENCFGVPGKQISIERIVVEHQGTGTPLELSFYSSIDGGNTWQGPFPASSTGSNGLCTLHSTMRRQGDRVRFKIVHESAEQGFRILKFNVRVQLHEAQVYSNAN